MEPLYTPVIWVARALFAAQGLKFTVTGAQNIPTSGGAVLMINHLSYFDFAYAGLAAVPSKRLVRFMAKDDVFRHRISGPLMRGMHHIPVDMERGAAAYAEAVAALRAGELIGVFPEAGVSASFEVRELKSGAVRLAAEAGVPVIPVAVWGGQRLMTKNHPVAFRERFGVPISFAFGAPINVVPTDDPRAVTDSLRETMQGMVNGLQSGYPVDGTGQWWQPRSRGGTAPTPAEAAATEAERASRRKQARSTVTGAP